jgi:hypothetical protein
LLNGYLPIRCRPLADTAGVPVRRTVSLTGALPAVVTKNTPLDAHSSAGTTKSLSRHQQMHGLIAPRTSPPRAHSMHSANSVTMDAVLLGVGSRIDAVASFAIV